MAAGSFVRFAGEAQDADHREESASPFELAGADQHTTLVGFAEDLSILVLGRFANAARHMPSSSS